MTDSAPSFVQRNAFLLAAAGLPFVVVLFFLAATTIPRWTVDDPAHDLIFALNHYDRSQPDIVVEYRIENGRLAAVARRAPNAGYGTHQQLYRYHVRSRKLEALSIEVPQELRQRLIDRPLVAGESPPSESFLPEQFDDANLWTEPVAPDGYTFEHQHSGHRGLFGELFGMGRGGWRIGLSKSGRVVSIEPPAGQVRHYYGSAVFLAWMEASS